MNRRRLLLRQMPIEEPALNLTPLIDVVFVLLIGFIIIAPLLQIDEIQLAKTPSALQEMRQNAQTASPIAIHVRQDNSLWWENRPIELNQLYPLLKEAKLRYPKAIPQLFHDKRGLFGTYQEVKNVLEMTGFEQVDIILQPS